MTRAQAGETGETMFVNIRLKKRGCSAVWKKTFQDESESDRSTTMKAEIHTLLYTEAVWTFSDVAVADMVVFSFPVSIATVTAERLRDIRV